MLALPLLALLAADPPRDAREILSNCTRQVDHGASVFDCKGVLIHASDEKQPIAKVMKQLQTSWERKSNVENTVTTKPFPMEGRTLDAMHVHSTVQGQPIAYGQWIVFSDAPNKTRVLGCTANVLETYQTRCTLMLRTLIDADATFLAEKPTVMFAGKPKVVPKNCQVTGASGRDYQVACDGGGGGFTYAATANGKDADGALAMTMEFFSKKVPSTKELPVETCTIGGVAGKCRVLRNDDWVLRGGTYAGADGTAVVTCTQNPGNKGYPPVCADVFKAK
jgi:hypothetical protein